ncbi:MAG: hypothetical protein GY778_29320 [bacterium]|nr:hypothetical protein [bacterium]
MCERMSIGIALLGLAVWVGSASAAETLYPAKDGTILDGGTAFSFDGTPDEADWYFNQSSYEGAIARNVENRAIDLERRVVWEYDLSGVTLTPPVSATLTFTVYGANVWPRPDTELQIYSYPADLVESLSDYDSAPTVLQGQVTVVAFQEATENIDVSAVVNAALTGGTDKVAFRFQIDPNTPHAANEAFIDSLDTEPETKPTLTIDLPPAVPGDADGDGDVDLVDYAVFESCLRGPVVATPQGCDTMDLNSDNHVDLADFAAFQAYLAG